MEEMEKNYFAVGEKMEEGEKETNNEVTVERDERMIKVRNFLLILFYRAVNLNKIGSDKRTLPNWENPPKFPII